MNHIPEILLVSWALIVIALLNTVAFSLLNSIDLERRELLSSINRIYVTLIRVNSALINSTLTISINIPVDHRIIFERENEVNKLIVSGPKVDQRLRDVVESILKRVDENFKLIKDILFSYRSGVGNLTIVFTDKLCGFKETKVFTHRSSAIRMTLIRVMEEGGIRLFIEISEV